MGVVRDVERQREQPIHFCVLLEHPGLRPHGPVDIDEAGRGVDRGSTDVGTAMTGFLAAML